jgi:DNA-binding MarR family transcriptional regulator
VPDPTDGRANLLRLTERGTDMLQLAVGIQADLENSRPDEMWRSGRIPLDG